MNFKIAHLRQILPILGKLCQNLKVWEDNFRVRANRVLDRLNKRPGLQTLRPFPGPVKKLEKRLCADGRPWIPSLTVAVGFVLVNTSVCWSKSSSHADPGRKVTICTLDRGPESAREKKVLEILRKKLKSCPNCEIISYASFEKNGDINSEKFLNSVEQAKAHCDVINISWNILSNSKTPIMEFALANVAINKFLIAAGGAYEQGPPKALEATVMGKIPEAYLIGELDSKGQLTAHAFSGPQMFTALKVNSQYPGSAYTAPVFAAAVSTWLSFHPKSEWQRLKVRLYDAKKKSKQKFPNLKTLGL